LAGNSLNLEIIVARPSGGPLVQGYMDGDPTAQAFFSGHFSDPAAYEAKAAEVDGRFDRTARARAAEAIGVPRLLVATVLGWSASLRRGATW
jgi:hypothetical protein